MRFHCAGTHAGAAAAVRNAKGLVQVEVGHVRTPLARFGHADQSVHVGAIGINLSAVLVHDLADLDDVLLEHAVGRRVGDHDRRQAFAVFLGIAADVFDIHVAVGIAFGHHDLHPAHLRRRRVGAMCRFRDQADVAPGFPARGVISADREQTGVFALCAGVGLQADGVVAGAFHQHRFQALDQFLVTLHLRGRCEGVDIAEFRPGHRDHLGGGIELHRAGTQRDHGAIHGQVLVRQRAHVAQQFMLAVVGVEDWMSEEGAAACQRVRDQRRRTRIQRIDGRQRGVVGREDAPQQFQVGARGRFIQ